MKTQSKTIRRDWVAKTLAGIVLGGVIAFGCSGLLVQLNPGIPMSVRGQLAMWLVSPVWLGILGGVYFFASGIHAWLWLSIASTLVLGVFYSRILI